MAESRTLLIEIGTEDLPPGLEQELSGFSSFLYDRLEREQFIEANPTAAEELVFPSLYTPRRLAAKISDVRTHQPESTERRNGPRATQIDPDDPATRGFAKSCRIDVGQLEIHGGRLCCDVKTGGRALREMLPSLLSRTLNRMNIERRMRWGAQVKARKGAQVEEYTFARPIRWLCALHGKEPIDFELFGLRSGRTTCGHRFHHPAALQLDSADDYEEELKETGQVIVDSTKREEKIQAQLGDVDTRRLIEAAAMTEWPQVLDIDFDEKFLSLPPEVMTQALETGLKAFVKKDPDPVSGKLLPQISIVADIESKEPGIIECGYRRVAHARLEDAQFFFEQGRKTTLEARREFLKRTLFQEKLGTLDDKSARLIKLVEWLAPYCGASLEHARRAAELCKCDLGTDIVGEYPQLQGIIGGYYAKADGEDDKVATAIKEHYQPHRPHAIPTAPESVALAIADRIDTLAGFWRIDLTPSGSKDPYGLNRATEGLLLLLIENRIDLDLIDLTAKAMAGYDAGLGGACLSEIKKMFDRAIFGTRNLVATRYINTPDDGDAEDAGIHKGLLAESVTHADPEPTKSYDFVLRLKAVADFVNKDPDASSLVQANKRIGNLLKKDDAEAAEPRADIMTEPAERALLKTIDACQEDSDRRLKARDYAAAMKKKDDAEAVEPSADIMTEPAERALLETIDACQEDFDRRLEARDYAAAMKMLAGLREPIDKLFDETLILAEDSKIRDNRLALLRKTRRMFLRIADFSRIHIPMAPAEPMAPADD